MGLRAVCSWIKQYIFPSSQRRGGRDINKMSRSLLCRSGRGGQLGKNLRSEDFAELTTIRASRYRARLRHFGGFAALIDAAATPPFQRGEYGTND